MYNWVWAVSFHVESLTELSAIATALWLLLLNVVFPRQPTRGKLQELSLGEPGEEGGREACHLNLLFNKTFPFFPFIGIDFPQPHGYSFLLVRFLRKTLNIYDISPSLYFFISSCHILSFMLFCFSPWYYCCINPSTYRYFFLPIFFSRSVPSSHDVCTAGIQLRALILLYSLIMLSQLFF